MEIIFVLIIVFFVSWKIYEFIYYYTKDFKTIKQKIELHILNCNELNNYIEKLKASYVEIRQLDYGQSYYHDNSIYNYKRPKLKEQMYLPYVYTCSRTVCDNARKQPFKYICKYFNIKANEEWLSKFEWILNNYESVEEGKQKLINEKERIMQSIKKDIPFLIRHFSKKLSRKLGLLDIDLYTMYFPRFIFQYISPGGYASMQCDVIMDINNLNRFIQYLSDVIAFRKTAYGQRLLMTSSLRQYILQRDNYTCQICGNSLSNEPNLLLEVDHIIPISKGGVTIEDNLQTLCWKCNRHKSNKMYEVNKKVDNTNEFYTRHQEEPNVEITHKFESIKNVNYTELKNENGINDKIVPKEDNKEEKTMYDTEKGIYPSGQYLVGKDIPLGGYILVAKTGKTAYIQLYPSYKDYKTENNAITYDDFDDDYHISLMEENTYMIVENAEIRKI